MIESNNKKRQLIKIIKEHVIKNLNGYNYATEFKTFFAYPWENENDKKFVMKMSDVNSSIYAHQPPIFLKKFLNWKLKYNERLIKNCSNEFRSGLEKLKNGHAGRKRTN